MLQNEDKHDKYNVANEVKVNQVLVLILIQNRFVESLSKTNRLGVANCTL